MVFLISGSPENINSAVLQTRELQPVFFFSPYKVKYLYVTQNITADPVQMMLSKLKKATIYFVFWREETAALFGLVISS